MQTQHTCTRRTSVHSAFARRRNADDAANFSCTSSRRHTSPSHVRSFEMEIRIYDDVTDAQNASTTKAQCSGRISLILRLPKRMPMHFPHNHTVSARLALSLSPSFCSLLAQHRLVMQVYARVHRDAKKGSNCSECRTHALCRWSKVSIRCSLRLH